MAAQYRTVDTAALYKTVALQQTVDAAAFSLYRSIHTYIPQKRNTDPGL